MTNLFTRFFKKEKLFNYVIAEYQPIKIDRMRLDVNVTEYEAEQIKPLEELDEMQIDNIYKGM